ncbi:uncharacterized protein STEHIDRAFT_151172 [Stereum hirsutum FP-91666 SS1]|uniref:uncharacterized protein n=1 Tax=Stereum hirsutum (strain FP-91666) TaxID=721885 RepID=UPI000440C32C|nr:uncharacterized protein STEHIDRAFT_151172 [Stereum hirsutum FP-91666 SS1]EIM91813.1 hypothetical protein STEHIDRAFT_151172 [Stereum hirsutum FP-91666 SS1]
MAALDKIPSLKTITDPLTSGHKQQPHHPLSPTNYPKAEEAQERSIFLPPLGILLSKSGDTGWTWYAASTGAVPPSDSQYAGNLTPSPF